jgi:hypothetical protein
MFRTNQEEGATIMPLVLCRSAGGPFDDAAFDSGWRLGQLAAMLGRGEVRSLAESIRPVERRQADLIAMARGFTISVVPSSDPEWLLVEFELMVDEL